MKWEYLAVFVDFDGTTTLTNKLNVFGADGWELVSVQSYYDWNKDEECDIHESHDQDLGSACLEPHHLIFKRPKADESN